MFKNLLVVSLACLALLTSCDSSQDATNLQSSDANAANSALAITIPEKIRSSRAVNLEETRAIVDSSAGRVELTRNGNQFEGSIRVPPGSVFTFTVSIIGQFNGQSIIYATSTPGYTTQPVIQDDEVLVQIGTFEYPDADGDGESNLEELNSGSNPLNSSSTPSNPDGTPARAGVLQFVSSTYSVTEDAGTLVVSVSRSGGSDGRVSVRYELKSETAIIGTDFDAASSVLVWEDGDTSTKNFTITVRNDSTNEGEQTFTATLSNPGGGAAIGNGVAQVTLIDSTPPPQRGTISFVNANASVNENTGQIQLEVQRTGGSDGAVSIDYATESGTATDGDFTAVSQTINWNDGQDGPRTITININNDSEVEADETFTVVLSNQRGGASLGPRTATVTITDTTPVPVPGQIAFAQNGYSVTEGRNINVVVERLQGADGAVSVDYATVAGTATAADFTAISGTLNWPDGDNGPRSITLNTTADDVPEVDENLTVTLSNATGQATIGNSSTSVTITDATVVRPGALSFATSALSMNEGTRISVNVTRNGGNNGAIAVTVSAPASNAYTVSPATLSWADGEDSALPITITAESNAVIGDDQTFVIQLLNATNGASINTGALNVTINDTTEPVIVVPNPTRENDGEWEVCFAPYNTSGPTAYATQLSATEGRVVNCVKTCPENNVPDDQFPGWGWNSVDLHSCILSTAAPGTYTKVPVYTPQRQAITTNLSTTAFTGEDVIWACVKESRQNAEFNYIVDNNNTIWYQFFNDGTYLYGSTPDRTQPVEMLGPDVWSATGRVLELGHINTGYRNTLLFPGNRTLHIHPTTDDRLNCSRTSIAAPGTTVQKGMNNPVVDGLPGDSEYSGGFQGQVSTVIESNGVRGARINPLFTMGHDGTYLYIRTNIPKQLNSDSFAGDGALWDDDSFEIYFDLGNEGTTGYDSNDFLRIFGAGKTIPDSVDGSNSQASLTHVARCAVQAVLPEYNNESCEVRFSLAEMGLEGPGPREFGFDIQWGLDFDGDSRDRKQSWCGGDTINAWRDMSTIGCSITLVD